MGNELDRILGVAKEESAVDFLHKEFDLSAEDVVEVTLDHAANVQLLDPPNYEAYRTGRQYRYYGGYFTTSPVRLAAPQAGHWHLVIDLGGNAGRVRASARILSSASA
jgi:hypothetical protein